MRVVEVVLLCALFGVLLAARLPSENTFEKRIESFEMARRSAQLTGSHVRKSSGRLETLQENYYGTSGDKLARRRDEEIWNMVRDSTDTAEDNDKTKSTDGQGETTGTGLSVSRVSESDTGPPVHCPCRLLPVSGPSECLTVRDRRTMRCEPRACEASYKCDSSVTDTICMLRKATRKVVRDVARSGFCVEKAIDEDFYVLYEGDIADIAESLP